MVGVACACGSRKQRSDQCCHVSTRAAGAVQECSHICLVVPPLQVVGTRGDVQPFVGIGLKLKEYGHRVRIASHAVYREVGAEGGKLPNLCWPKELNNRGCPGLAGVAVLSIRAE
jgi:hypothetical protein